MTAARTYLDWNASAPLRPEARQAMIEAFDPIGNPSSVHAEGRKRRAVIEGAREAVARLASARPSEVVFTSGATEANATVMAAGWDVIYAGATEHDSVLAPARMSRARLSIVPVDQDGFVQLGWLADHLVREPAGARVLVAVQAANNETGVIQPVDAIGAFVRSLGMTLHVDAVQACGRTDLAKLCEHADLVAISAHKLGGPSGVGALIIRGPTALEPLLVGGGQERRRRAGTENVLGVTGFGAAAAALQTDHTASLEARHRAFEAELLRTLPGAWIAGANAPRLPNTTCLVWPGHSAETLVIKFDLAGYAVSAGAACSSGKVAASHVLAAMQIPADEARSAIRISIGATTTEAELKAFVATAARLDQPARRAA